MTTKPPGKDREEARTAERTEPAMQTAYQVHTLAQILYGQLAMTQPWGAQLRPSMYEPAMPPLQAPWGAQAWPSMYEPAMQPSRAPWSAQAWPSMYEPPMLSPQAQWASHLPAFWGVGATTPPYGPYPHTIGSHGFPY